MFDHLEFDDHEVVKHASDASTGLRAIVAIHSTHRGPALGGCRVWQYRDPRSALADVLRLSRGMTYKNALADLPLGGGKSVVMLDGGMAKSPALFEALGRAVDRLSGHYVVAEDVGSTPDDMVAVRRQTAHVTGLPASAGGFGCPSPYTAEGVFIGLRATASALGRELSGLHVAIQGLGAVGRGVAQRLHDAGARLTVADLNGRAVADAQARWGARVVPVHEIAAVDADVFSPNALGAVLDAATIADLKVDAVAGAANNQLATPQDGEALSRRGILYAPDYVLNAGGVIKACGEYLGWPAAEVDRRVAAIGPRLAAIFSEASKTGRSPADVADRWARRLISESAPAANRADLSHLAEAS